jgi:hypothetical protein
MKNIWMVLLVPAAIGAWGCSPEENVVPETKEKFVVDMGGKQLAVSEYGNYSGGGVITIDAELDDGSNLFVRIIVSNEKVYQINKSSESFVIYTNENQVEFSSKSAAANAVLTLDTINYKESWLSGSIASLTLASGAGGQVTLDNCSFTKISLKVNENIKNGKISTKIGNNLWNADTIVSRSYSGHLAFFGDRKSDGSQIRVLLKPNQQVGAFNLTISSTSTIQFSGNSMLFAWGGYLQVAKHDLRARSIGGTFQFSGCLTPDSGCTSFTQGSFSLWY